ncbi:MAG TPA: glycosyltransferase family 1 protein [Patescibacteria group bacterium]
MEEPKTVYIGIDGNEANIAMRVGVNEYAYQILWGLWRLISYTREKQIVPKDREKAYSEKVTKPIVITVFLKYPPQPHMPPASDNFRYKVLGGGGMWIVTRLMPHLFMSHDRLDVFFTPSHYIPPFALQPRVCSIMDLGYLVFSGQFRKRDYWQLRLWSAWSMARSKRVLAISSSTKDDIVRHYPGYLSKIVVTPLGYDASTYNERRSREDIRHIEEVKKKYSIVNNYILFLGTLKPSKNIEGLVEAWGKIVNKYSDFTLVIGGKRGWLYDTIFSKVKNLGLTGRVVFTDYLNEEDKVSLIKGAHVFVIPSFWEGFGIDALTSMASGVPVVAGDRGSLKEVVGNAGLLVNPKDTDDIANKISEVLGMSKKEYNRIVVKGLEKAKEFSWEKTAKVTLETLVEVAEGK